MFKLWKNGIFGKWGKVHTEATLMCQNRVLNDGRGITKLTEMISKGHWPEHRTLTWLILIRWPININQVNVLHCKKLKHIKTHIIKHISATKKKHPLVFQCFNKAHSKNTAACFWENALMRFRPATKKKHPFAFYLKTWVY